MELELKQVLTKTPQGINATRSGAGLSPKSHAVLKSFDGTKSVAELKKVCVSAVISAADFDAALKELQKFEYLRTVDAAAEAKAKVAAEAEARMLLTLDFTAAPPAAPVARPPAAKSPAAAAPAVAKQPVANAVPARTAVAAPALPAAAPAPAAPSADDLTREEKAARMKREAEVHQKLVMALQPQVEEELRTRLRPKLEEELRPKLIAALRPGIEAEVRTRLINELTPRIEVELKARFAKSLAAQKAADQQAAQADAAPAVVAAAAATPAATDGAFERVLASMNMPVFSVDLDGVCTYMSPAWAQFSGYTAAETAGKPLADFFADTDRRAVSSFISGIAGGTALRFEQQGALMRKGGEPLWVELSAAPLYSASGSPMGVCGALRDAAQTRRLAAQAEADGVRLLLLVDQIDTGVILEDGEGNIQQANSALCTLLSLDAAPYSLEGMAVAELLERAAQGFIGPDGFLHRTAEIRAAGEDTKDETFVMADGRVLSQDYLAIAVDDATVGRLWLFREVPRAQARAAP
jgi:PAS domain S-box-containing protein